jgi:hypothetical protein
MIPRLKVITWLYGCLTSLSTTRTKFNIVMSSLPRTAAAAAAAGSEAAARRRRGTRVTPATCARPGRRQDQFPGPQSLFAREPNLNSTREIRSTISVIRPVDLGSSWACIQVGPRSAIRCRCNTTQLSTPKISQKCQLSQIFGLGNAVEVRVDGHERNFFCLKPN